MDARVPRGQSVVPLGYVSGVYGLQGWVKVHSWTSPRDAILEYRPWLLGEKREAIDIVVGLDVMGKDGSRLGRIEKMLETGANDVMVVAGEREMLVPFVPGVYVIEVDLEAGTVVVDWQQDYLA